MAGRANIAAVQAFAYAASAILVSFLMVQFLADRGAPLSHSIFMTALINKF